MDKKIRHLEMIERAITRNGIYRFGIKSLTMYFVISMFSIYEDYEQDIFLMISLLPLVILCLLDAFYLQQQRLLSSLFNHVRALDEDTIDFYMAPRTKDFQEDKNFLFNCIISWSVLGFYLPLAFVTTYDIFSYFYL